MAQSLSLELFPEPSPAEPSPQAEAVNARPQEWLGIWFEHLPMEALGIPSKSQEAIALVEGQGRNALISGCTVGASKCGIRSGQNVTAALALSSALRIIERDSRKEHKALRQLALQAQRFTPTVSLEEPDALLLEVAGSAHLFGGREGVMERAQEVFSRMGFTSHLAMAPTSLASLWLARAHQSICVSPASLGSRLGDIPIHIPAWPPALRANLARLGIKRLRDLMRLPRDGLVKRFGPTLVRQLDQALGRMPDPRITWQGILPCRLRRELPVESDRLELLLPFIMIMLDELSMLLRARDAAVDVIYLLFRHAGSPPTRFRIGSIASHRDPRQWQILIDTQLQNKSFPAPVTEILLISGSLRPYEAINHSLLSDEHDIAHETSKLLALLQARLGDAAVYGVSALADARPEQAWEMVAPGRANTEIPLLGRRPLLLLPVPQPLNSHNGLPGYRGAALKLMPSPERIAGAWWEGESWQRDYYQARSGDGTRLWIYRCGSDWFLHGFFS